MPWKPCLAIRSRVASLLSDASCAALDSQRSAKVTSGASLPARRAAPVAASSCLRVGLLQGGGAMLPAGGSGPVRRYDHGWERMIHPRDASGSPYLLILDRKRVVETMVLNSVEALSTIALRT